MLLCDSPRNVCLFGKGGLSGSSTAMCPGDGLWPGEGPPLALAGVVDSATEGSEYCRPFSRIVGGRKGLFRSDAMRAACYPALRRARPRPPTFSPMYQQHGHVAVMHAEAPSGVNGLRDSLTEKGCGKSKERRYTLILSCS